MKKNNLAHFKFDQKLTARMAKKTGFTITSEEMKILHNKLKNVIIPAFAELDTIPTSPHKIALWPIIPQKSDFRSPIVMKQKTNLFTLNQRTLDANSLFRIKNVRPKTPQKND